MRLLYQMVLLLLVMTVLTDARKYNFMQKYFRMKRSVKSTLPTNAPVSDPSAPVGDSGNLAGDPNAAIEDSSNLADDPNAVTEDSSNLAGDSSTSTDNPNAKPSSSSAKTDASNGSATNASSITSKPDTGDSSASTTTSMDLDSLDSTSANSTVASTVNNQSAMNNQSVETDARLSANNSTNNETDNSIVTPTGDIPNEELTPTVMEKTSSYPLTTKPIGPSFPSVSPTDVIDRLVTENGTSTTPPVTSASSFAGSRSSTPRPQTNGSRSTPLPESESGEFLDVSDVADMVTGAADGSGSDVTEAIGQFPSTTTIDTVHKATQLILNTTPSSSSNRNSSSTFETTTEASGNSGFSESQTSTDSTIQRLSFKTTTKTELPNSSTSSSQRPSIQPEATSPKSTTPRSSQNRTAKATTPAPRSTSTRNSPRPASSSTLMATVTESINGSSSSNSSSVSCMMCGAYIADMLTWENYTGVAILSAMLIGGLFIIIVVGLAAKRCYEGITYRGYSKVDYLINGMYDGQHEDE